MPADGNGSDLSPFVTGALCSGSLCGHLERAPGLGEKIKLYHLFFWLEIPESLFEIMSWRLWD